MSKIIYPDKTTGDSFSGTEATEIKDSVNELYNTLLPVTNDKTIFLPTYIYTTCNDIITLSIMAGYLGRNYNAKLYIERLFEFLSDSHNYRPTFEKNRLKKEIYSPISAYNGTFNSETTVVGSGDSVAKTTKSLTIDIENSDTASLSITHRSVAATNGKTTPVFALFIGDSITNKSGADYGAISGDASVYWSWIQRLFLMDKIDGGDNTGEYNITMLGAQSVHDFSFTYKSVDKTIRSCAEGRSGWDTTDYAANEWRDNEVNNYAGYNFFYNSAGTNCKFSIQKWLDHYRTLDDSGNRLAIDDPALGDRIVDDITYAALSDTNKKIYRRWSDNWNVCTPTHIIFQLGTNDATNTGALTNLQNMIAEIRLEGFTTQHIGLAFVGAAGAIYPERYEEQYDKDSILLTYSFTSKAKLFCNSYKSIESDANKIYFIPTYFVQPTGDGISMRNIDNMQLLIDSTKTFGTTFGNQATLHPNVLAHLEWAYQYYSWIKWTL